MDTSSTEVRDRILALYAEVDREIAEIGPRCESSGRCCRFKEYGHTLFISELEAKVLLDAAPFFEGPITADFCPFQKENLCTAREPRPLACRIYYCDPTYQNRGQEISEKSLRKLKNLADELDAGWRYAPLHVFLKEHLERREETREKSPTESQLAQKSGRISAAVHV